MELKNIIFILFFLVSILFFIWSCRNLVHYMLVAKKKDNRFDKIGERLKRVWVIAFAQTKLLRDPKAGILHLIIFWGFLFSFYSQLYGHALFGYNFYPGYFFSSCNCFLFICFIQKVHPAYPAARS